MEQSMGRLLCKVKSKIEKVKQKNQEKVYAEYIYLPK